MLYSSTFFLFTVLLILMLDSPYVSSMTREQIKNSGKLIKKTCSAKNGLTEDQVKDVDKGKFIEEKNFMCYIACVYKMGQTIKGNTINHDMMLRQVDMMFPTEMKVPVKAAIEHCRGVAKNYKDVCEASYWTAKCTYEFDPANFMFP
uniref:Odorant binding protein 12 n=1 Tax=Athetis dissimilis TaxID=1737331 RepID=A0A109XL66_ATHDI|nr:odorant binding protein 12 [Athetis dissimilis]